MKTNKPFRTAWQVRSFLLVFLLAWVVPAAQAVTFVPFVPSDLNPGDTYHVAFLTDGGRTGVITGIDGYNQFVQEQAELSGAETETWGVSWFAIASTVGGADAKDNIPVTGSPIYLLTDVRVADNAADLWDGSIQNEISVTQFGASVLLQDVWTGTDDDGTVFPTQGLGLGTPRQGSSSATNGNWVNAEAGLASSVLPFYAVSEELTVGGDTGVQPPVADANGPYTGEAGEAVSFDGSGSKDSDGTIESWEWDFGDTNTGSGETTTHTYATADVYTVTLTVTDNDSISDSASAQAYIGQGNQDPVADANGPYTGEAGEAVSFDGSGSKDSDGTIESYAWDFGDNNTGSGKTTTHTYGSADLYTVTLTVTDNGGASDSDSTQATIGVSDQPPVADANGPYEGSAGVAVSFDGSASSDADGTIETYDWDFGDGNTGSGETTTHTYAATGNYTVSLTVTDNDSLSDSNDTTASIGVGNQPPVADANGPYGGDVGASIRFDGNASEDPDGTIESWEWRFGDGMTDTGPTPTHSYSEAGKYFVLLTVTDDQGVPDSTVTFADIGPVDLSGTVEDAGGTPLCSLVLASGQFMFTCNPNGPYSLLDLPRETDGSVKRQVYVDGFFPNVETLTGTVDETVTMTRAGTCTDYNAFPDPGVNTGSAGKRIDISGKIVLQNTETPVCAMVLANGQFAFTCDGSGSYAGNIPLDNNGQYKLQVYAQGFAPMIQRFDEFSPNNDVRMARAVECQ